MLAAARTPRGHGEEVSERHAGRQDRQGERKIEPQARLALSLGVVAVDGRPNRQPWQGDYGQIEVVGQIAPEPDPRSPERRDLGVSVAEDRIIVLAIDAGLSASFAAHGGFRWLRESVTVALWAQKSSFHTRQESAEIGSSGCANTRRSPAAPRAWHSRLTPAAQPCASSSAITSELALKERGACNLVDTRTA